MHPRCRCAIIYDEVAAPKLPKPKQRKNGKGNLEIPALKDLSKEVIKPSNTAFLNNTLKKYLTANYIIIDTTSDKFMAYSVNSEKIFYNPNHKDAPFYDKTESLIHEIAHLIDYEFGISVSLRNEIFEAVEEAKEIIFTNREFYEKILEGKLGDNMEISDLVSAFTDSEIYGAFAHSSEYWSIIGNREREIVAELATIYYIDDLEGISFIKSFPKLKFLFETGYEKSRG